MVFTIVHEKPRTGNREPRPIASQLTAKGTKETVPEPFGLDARSGPRGCARVVTGLRPVRGKVPQPHRT